MLRLITSRLFYENTPSVATLSHTSDGKNYSPEDCLGEQSETDVGEMKHLGVFLAQGREQCTDRHETHGLGEMLRSVCFGSGKGAMH